MPRKINATLRNATPDFLTDPEAAAILNIGISRFLELQKRADFPPPVWLGPRGKRHPRAALLAWALTLRGKWAA